MEQAQVKEIIELKRDVNDLKEVVENITILLNKKLMIELYQEAKSIQEGEYYSEEEFIKKHKIKTLQNP